MNCETCARPMRPYDTTAKDHPGTVLQSSTTMCQPCRRKRLAHRDRSPRPTGDAIQREYAAFLAAREARGVPPSGRPATHRYVSVAIQQHGRTRLETQQAAMWKFRAYRIRKHVLTGPPVGVWDGTTFILYAPIKRAVRCAA